MCDLHQVFPHGETYVCDLHQAMPHRETYMCFLARVHKTRIFLVLPVVPSVCNIRRTSFGVDIE